MTLSSIHNKSYIEYGLITAILTILLGSIALKGGDLTPVLVLGLSLCAVLCFLFWRIQGFIFLFAILLSLPILEQLEGINILEIPFFSLSLLVMIYVVAEVFKGSILLETTLDKFFLFLLFLLPYATVWGLFNGASPIKAVGEITYFFGVIYYFPARKYMTKRAFQYILAGIVTVIIGYVLIRNVINYRAIITQAVVPWQAEKARVAANEFVLLMGASLAMSAAATARSLFRQLLFTGVFLPLLGGIILTQSRGYWLAFFFSAVWIFLIINKRGKLKILLTGLILSFLGIVIGSLFFSDTFSTILNGLFIRLQSLGSGELDLSLKDRLYESLAVWELISHNPITGYGLGYTFTRNALFHNIHIQTSYIHNGYLAAWFKFGLPGLITIISIWFICIKYALNLYRQSKNKIHKTLSLAISGTVVGVLFVNNTSSQILLFESMLFISLFGAYLSTYITKKNA